MGLNDDVMDDIDITTDSNFINDDTMKTVSENINTIIKDTDSTVDNTLLNRVVSADVAIKNLDDAYTSICEKKNVEENVISKESLSRIDAEIIQSVFKGLLTPTITLEQFTSVDSKTNYSYTLRYVANSISLEQDNMNINYSLFLNTSLNDICAVLNKLKESYIVILRDSLNYLKFTNNDIHNKLLNNKNLVVNYGGGFENVAKLNISDMNVKDIKPSINDLENIEKTIINIKTLLEDKDINSFIKCIYNQEDLNCIFEPVYGIEMVPSNGLSLADAIESSIIDKHIDSSDTQITELLKRIDILIQDNTKNIGDFEKISSDFENLKLESINIISRSMVVTNLVVKLVSLINSLETLFEFYKKF